MSEIKHTILLLVAILLAYFWLITPQLNSYSLQAFSVATLLFFILKRMTKAKIWHILPKNHSYEMFLVSFALIILVGSTGNTHSLFYPFSYIHLFFLVMTCGEKTAITSTMAILLVHYALSPVVSVEELTTLATIPLMLIFFLFAKKQYDEVISNQKIIEKEQDTIISLTNSEHSLEGFISEFLKPKLQVLQALLEENTEKETPMNTQVLKSQIDLLETESEKILKKTQE